MTRAVFLSVLAIVWAGCECGSPSLIDAGMGGTFGGGDAGDAGGAGSGGAGGHGGMDASMMACDPGTTRDCYTGPPGTVNVGACIAGTETCNDEGTGYDACDGEVVPSTEVVTQPGQPMVDEDCDTRFDEAP